MVKGDGPGEGADAAPAGAGDPHKHLSTLPGWREFTALAPGQPELLAAAEYAALGGDARAAYDEERLDYHTRLGVVGTSVLRQVVTTGRRLTLLNRHAISARRGLILSGAAGTGKTTAITQLGKTHEATDRARHPGPGTDPRHLRDRPAGGDAADAGHGIRPVPRAADPGPRQHDRHHRGRLRRRDRHVGQHGPGRRDPQHAAGHPQRRRSLRHPQVPVRADPGHVRLRGDRPGAPGPVLRHPGKPDRRPVHPHPHAAVPARRRVAGPGRHPRRRPAPPPPPGRDPGRARPLPPPAHRRDDRQPVPPDPRRGHRGDPRPAPSRSPGSCWTPSTSTTPPSRNQLPGRPPPAAPRPAGDRRSSPAAAAAAADPAPARQRRIDLLLYPPSRRRQPPAPAAPAPLPQGPRPRRRLPAQLARRPGRTARHVPAACPRRPAASRRRPRERPPA